MHHMRPLAAGVAAAAVVAALAGCSAESGSSTSSTIVIGDVATAAYGWDPNQPGSVGWYTWAGDTAYQTVIRGAIVDGAASFGPDVATAWKFNNDTTAITLTIRQGTKFTDNAPLDAAAVKTNINYNTKGRKKNGYAVPFGDVSVDGNNVTIQITKAGHNEGRPRLLDDLRSTFIVSPKALADPSVLKNNPVGSGPYILDQKATRAGVSYTFERNKDYWNTKAYSYDKVIIKIYPDAVSAGNALKTGQVQVANLTAANAADIKGAGLNVQHSVVSWQGLFLGDRTGKIQPALADVRVRQAMNYAFDRAAIAKSIDRGFADPSDQPWGPASGTLYSKSLESQYSYDPKKAKELLAEAGYPHGFALTIPSWNMPQYDVYNPVIKQYLGDIGIKVTFRQLTSADFVPSVQSAKYAVVNDGNYYINTIPFFIINGGLLNNWGYQDNTADSDMNTISYGDSTAAASAGTDLSKHVLDQAWFVVFDHPYYLIGSAKGVTVNMNGMARVAGAAILDIHPSK